METYYTVERNIQIVIAYLKAYDIRNVIVSPGATNISFVASIQQDTFFKLYSAPDERSAAYMACGLAAESLSPVVLSCTGATASRNYVPGLTEAYYRRLPVLAITSTQCLSRVANQVPQVIDRSVIQNDIACLSVHLPFIRDEEDDYNVTVKTARAFISLTEPSGGPVHINLETRYSKDYSIETLPNARIIRQVLTDGEWPLMPKGRIGVFIGEHKPFTKKEEDLIDQFCFENDAVVICDQTSNYRGRARVLSALICFQHSFSELKTFDLLIHIGGVSGDYYTSGICNWSKEVWRVDIRGSVSDPFRKLTTVFKMEEQSFFKKCLIGAIPDNSSLLERWQAADCAARESLQGEIPFSNVWIASQLANKLPEGSSLHLGILNSLRSWNFFETPETVICYSNVGGFGIDGGISTLLGASLADPKKLFFGVFGDLAFFYDMNALANRHSGSNLRILLINNGMGTEFKIFNHPAAQFKDNAEPFIAAAGHYGNKSKNLVRHFAEDLGYRYLSADNKDTFSQQISSFINSSSDKSIIFEVFTDSEEESNALKLMQHLPESKPLTDNMSFRKQIKEIAKKTIGEKGVRIAKILMNKE